MITEIRMPQKGLSEQSAVLAEWHVKVGDAVQEGDHLFSIENGKAVFQIETEVAGTVLATFGSAGDEIPIKTVVCVVGDPGEVYVPQHSAPATEPAPAPVCAEQPVPTAVPIREDAASASVFASPRARHLAHDRHLDLSLIPGTGPRGRVIERDVLRAAEQNLAAVPAEAPSLQAASEAEYTVLPHTSTRKIIAQTMHQSLLQMAQVTNHTSFDATRLLAYHAALKQQGEGLGLPKISINDLVSFAVARTLQEHERLNAHCYEDALHIFRHVHLGIAVDTPRGLLVPTVRKADTLSLADLARESRRLVSACREGTVSPDELTGGTFTISNLGAFGMEHFTPIINPPQVAILGVCSLTDRIRVTDGAILPYKAMGLSLTYDHRALDGADASRFLQSLCRNLEQVDLLLAK